MVTISEVGVPPRRLVLHLQQRAQASSKASWSRCPWGRSSGMGVVVPSSPSKVVVRGLVSGSKMAFSWAPTVVVSLPARCHMPSRRCLKFQVPAVLLQLIIDGFGAVWIGSIDHA